MTNHITINNTVPRIRYVSNGVLATYTYPFAIFKSSDLKVYFGSVVQESSTYTVSGAGTSSGGTITLSTVPENGVIITLTRELSIERTTDFQEGGALRADTLNHELDYQIACQQQIADNLNRSMVLPPYAADANVNLTLPSPNAGKSIVWNAAGTNLENSTVSVNAMESTLNGYKIAAETAASTATAQATEATVQAQTATTQATTATTQAGIATQKAQEVSSALSQKINLDADNISATGKSTIMSWGLPDYGNPTAYRVSLASGENTMTISQPSYILALSPNTSGSGYINIVDLDHSSHVIDSTYVGSSGTKSVSASAFVPSGSFRIDVTGSGGDYSIYPLKGVA